MPNLTIQVRNDAWTKNPEEAQKTFVRATGRGGADERAVAREWCREVLLARVNDQDPKSASDSAGTGQVVLLAELVALREVLLNVLFRQATARPLRLRRCKG